jgi:F-type H+-transporting ATPase subunit gamma
MANLKEVRIRITSVTSTQQITKAMKLVSATKLRRAQNAITLMRPYAAKLNGILSNLSDSIDVDSLKIFFDERPVKNVLLVVITSDRGLCGSFNANVIKMANKTINEKYNNQKENGGVTVIGIGKKGHEYFSKQPVNYIDTFKESLSTPNSETGFAIGEYVLNQYKAGKIDAVEIVYNQFKNAATQILSSEQFLPINTATLSSDSSKKTIIYLNQIKKKFY